MATEPTTATVSTSTTPTVTVIAATQMPEDIPGRHPHVFVVPVEGPPPYEVAAKPTNRSVYGTLLQQYQLLDRMKNGTATSDDYFMFSYAITKITVDYIFGVGCLIITLCLPLAMIVLGSMYLHSCQAIPAIPALMIAIGSIISFCNLINIIDHFAGKFILPDNSMRSVFVALSNIILNGLVMVLFAFLCVWVYGSPEPDREDSNSPKYCHSAVYLFGYWLSTSVVAFIWFLFVISCICWCVSTTSD